MKKILVDCRRNGESIRVYEFGWPIGMVPGPPPERNRLIDDAKVNLTNERLAFPPWADIEFEVFYC